MKKTNLFLIGLFCIFSSTYLFATVNESIRIVTIKGKYDGKTPESGIICLGSEGTCYTISYPKDAEPSGGSSTTLPTYETFSACCIMPEPNDEHPNPECEIDLGPLTHKLTVDGNTHYYYLIKPTTRYGSKSEAIEWLINYIKNEPTN